MTTHRTLLAHGGAWAVPASERQPAVEAVRRAVRAGWNVLSQGASAVDAVSRAVREMEDDPALNAGRGAVLNLEGEVTLDAAIMDGESLEAGAVGSVQGVAHPVDLARRVMERSPHVLLVGAGALAFARAQGIPTCGASDLIVPRERARWGEAKGHNLSPGATSPFESDTVGAVARDGDGHVAAATSTGGSLLKLPGRVGDSPLVGCGLYADDRAGAASSTGWGEGIMRVVLAHRAVDLIAAAGDVSAAARQAIDLLESRTGGRGGLILIDPSGNPGWFFNTPHMAWVYLRSGMNEPAAGI